MEFTLIQDFPAGMEHRFHATAQVIEVELERDVPVDRSRLPPWSGSLVRDEQTLRHRTAWRRVSPTQVAAELDISPIGLPVRAHGIGTIVETAPGATTRMVLNWRVTSILPMMGQKVERLFADQIRVALVDDHAFTLQYLQRSASGRSPASSSTPEGAP
jgi:hypothetical protein